MTNTFSMSSSTSRSVRTKAPICRFSVMVMRVKVPRPSGTITRPWRTKSQAPWPFTGLPRYSMSPAATGWMPVMAFSVVVLPAPFAPMRLTSSPSRTSNDTPLTAWMPPYATLRPVTLSRVFAIARSSVSFVTGAEVRLDHLLVALHVVRRAFGDLLAVVEHRHAVAQAHHQLHVVLDEQDGAAVLADAVDELTQHDLLGGVHAGGRLVECDERGVGGQRAGD